MGDDPTDVTEIARQMLLDEEALVEDALDSFFSVFPADNIEPHVQPLLHVATATHTPPPTGDLHVFLGLPSGQFGY